MFSFIQSYYKSTKYMLALMRFDEDQITNIEYIDETYKGLDSQDTVLRVFYSKKNQLSLLLFFLVHPRMQKIILE